MDSTTSKPKTNGRRNRTAGHNWEREVVIQLKSIGFVNVVTARSESKSRDDKKIDIMNKDEDANGRLPYNIQCKCESKVSAYPKYLSEMPKGDYPNIIFHKQTKRSGSKFMVQDMYGIMYLKDLLHMMEVVRRSKVMESVYEKYVDKHLTEKERKALTRELTIKMNPTDE
jgi:hypothetical protein